MLARPKILEFRSPKYVNMQGHNMGVHKAKICMCVLLQLAYCPLGSDKTGRRVCVLSQLAYCPLWSDMTGRRVCCHSWHTAHCGQIWLEDVCVCVVTAGILPIVVRYDWKTYVCVLSQLASCPLWRRKRLRQRRMRV